MESHQGCSNARHFHRNVWQRELGSHLMHMVQVLDIKLANASATFESLGMSLTWNNSGKRRETPSYTFRSIGSPTRC